MFPSPSIPRVAANRCPGLVEFIRIILTDPGRGETARLSFERSKGRHRGEGIAIQRAEQRRATEPEREPAEEFPAFHLEIDVGALQVHEKPLIFTNRR